MTRYSGETDWQLTDAGEFPDRAAAAWDRINGEYGGSVLLSSAFVSKLIQHFGTGAEKLAIRGPGDEPDAMALIAPGSRGAWTTFQPSQAPLGLWVQRPGLPLGELAGELLAELPLTAHTLSILRCDPDLMPWPEKTGITEPVPYIETARITLEGRFTDYWGQRGKNLRHNIKRQHNRLEREGIRVSMRAVTEPSAVGEVVDAYGELESSGWKGQSGSALHPDNEQGAFYRDVMEGLARNGQASVFELYYNEARVASDLCISGDGDITILKTTYDESQTTTSPAQLLHYHELSHLFERSGLDRLEFHGEAMDWHRKWSDELRTMYHLNAYRSRWLASARSLYTRARSLTIRASK